MSLNQALSGHEPRSPVRTPSSSRRILRYQHRYGEELVSHQCDSLWQRGWALSSLLPGGSRKNVPSSSRYNSSSLERSRLRNTSKSSDRHCVTRLTTDFDTPVPLRTSANVASMSRVDIPCTYIRAISSSSSSVPTHIRIENLRTKTCRCLSNLRHLDRHRSFAGENSMRFIPVTTAFLLRRVDFTLNREDFSFVIHLDRQPRTSRRREAQTGSRARSGSR